MGSFRTQLKQVLRRLLRTPMFTAITLFTLVAAVGANTVVFSVLNGVLLKPLPYPQPDQLVSVLLTAPGVNIKDLVLSPSSYFVFRDQSSTFQDIGLYTPDTDTVTGMGDPEQVRTLRVTDGTLPILGYTPALGRMISREDDTPTSSETVMLSYGFWQGKFGGATDVIGKNLIVNGRPRQIIGVLQRDFHFLDEADPTLVIPLRFNRSKTLLGNFSYRSVARLRPGMTLAQATADVARMLPIINRSFPAPEGFSLKLFEDAHIGPNLQPLKQDVVGDIGNVLWVLMGSIGVVLLIACANVANLILVRVEGRRQELAIRTALGASRGRIALELLLESLILGVLGCALGLAVAAGALRVLVALGPTGLPRIHEINIDARVVLFTFLLSIISSLLFSIIPILKYSGVRLNTGLREGARGLSQSRDQHRARSILVVVQVGLAVVLLICSGLMIRTFRELMHVNPGFRDPVDVQTFRVYIPEAEVKETVKVARMFEEILHKLSAIQGVSSVALSTKIPMDPNANFDPVFAEDRQYREGELPPVRRFKFTTPGFLATLGTPLIAGRDFTWDDVFQTRPVSLVSENFAREYWNTPQNAIGKRVRVSSTDEWRQVVGVVANMYDDGVSRPPPTSVYWPIMTAHFENDAVNTQRDLAFAIRSPRAGTQSFLQEVRRAVWSVDPNLPLADVHTLDYFYKRSMARTSFTLIMLGSAASMALLLGVVGIYGVIAYSVAQRTREIGIRMALGAQPQAVTRMFVRHGIILACIGVVLGLGAAFAAMRLMSSLLFHVSPVDPITYASVSIGLIATASLACYLPSRRAAAVDPVDALRAE